MSAEQDSMPSEAKEEQDSDSRTGKKTWHPPKIQSVDVALATQGISYRPGDGISNLS